MDKLQFAYTKRRNEFGRQCMFVDRATELDVNVLPQAELTAQFIRKNPVDVRCEDGTILSEHEVPQLGSRITSNSSTCTVLTNVSQYKICMHI